MAVSTLIPARTGRFGLLASLFLGTFMALLDVSVVSVALPAIQHDLDAGLSELQWVIDGYTVALAATILTGGTLGDRFGRKRVYLSGLGLFTLASLGCALSPTLGVLVVARVVQGTAAATVIPGALSLLAHSFPEPAQRARVFGLWGSVAGLSFILGPVLGGPLTDALGWPTVFLLNLPLGLLAVLTGLRTITESSDPAHPSLDLPGQAFGVLTIGALTYGVIEGGHVGWSSASVWLPLVMGLIALAAFVGTELRATHPMLGIRLFANREFGVGNLASFVLGFGAYPMIFLVSLYLEQTRGATATEAGIQLLPYALANGIAAYLAGRLSGRFGIRAVMPAGYLAAAAGGLGFLALDAGSPYWLVAIVLAAGGAGIGMSVTPTNLVVLRGVPRQRSGIASATVNAARQTGMAFGVAVLGALITLRQDFVSGLHLALGTAGLLLLAMSVLTAGTLRGAGPTGTD